jgi:hypothetical protein
MLMAVLPDCQWPHYLLSALLCGDRHSDKKRWMKGGWGESLSHLSANIRHLGMKWTCIGFIGLKKHLLSRTHKTGIRMTRKGETFRFRVRDVQEREDTHTKKSWAERRKKTAFRVPVDDVACREPDREVETLAVRSPSIETFKLSDGQRERTL